MSDTQIPNIKANEMNRTVDALYKYVPVGMLSFIESFILNFFVCNSSLYRVFATSLYREL